MFPLLWKSSKLVSSFKLLCLDHVRLEELLLSDTPASVLQSVSPCVCAVVTVQDAMGSCVSGLPRGAISTDVMRASSLPSVCPVASVF